MLILQAGLQAVAGLSETIVCGADTKLQQKFGDTVSHKIIPPLADRSVTNKFYKEKDGNR